MDKEMQELYTEVLDLYKKGTPPSVIKKIISEKTGYKKTKSGELYNEIVCNIHPKEGPVGVMGPKCDIANDRVVSQDLSKAEISNKKYFYNECDKKYVFFLKSIGKNLVLPKTEVDYLIKSYSNFYGDEQSINDLSLKFNLPRAAVSEILDSLGCTHTSLPVSDVDVMEKDADVLVEEILQDKKFHLFQKLQKRDWQNTLKKAALWDTYELSAIEPFERILNTWTPPKYEPYEPVSHVVDGHSLIVTIADAHYGARANSSSMFRGEDHSTDKIVETMRQYYQRIIDDWKTYNWNIDSLVIISLGDILHSSNLIPQTSKGTLLQADLLNEEMFNVAFDSLVEFVDNLSRMAPKTTVYSFPGNHWGVGDSILFKAIGVYFRLQENIKFNIITAPAGYFKEKNSLIVAAHGASNFYKAKFPSGAKLQSYVQSMIIHSQEKVSGVKSRILFTADRHFHSSTELNDFEHYQCSSPVRGDHYADSLNLYSRPRQQAYILDNLGIKSVQNYFFD